MWTAQTLGCFRRDAPRIEVVQSTQQREVGPFDFSNSFRDLANSKVFDGVVLPVDNEDARMGQFGLDPFPVQSKKSETLAVSSTRPFREAYWRCLRSVAPRIPTSRGETTACPSLFSNPISRCVFRGKLSTDSGRSCPPIPEEVVQGFRRDVVHFFT